MYDYDSLFAWIADDRDVVNRPEEIAAQFSSGDDPQLVWAALWGLQKNQLATAPQIAEIYTQLCGRALDLAAEVFLAAAAESPQEMLPVLAGRTEVVVDVITRLMAERRRQAVVTVLNLLDPLTVAEVLAAFADRESGGWAANLVSEVRPESAAVALPHVLRLRGSSAWWVLAAPQPVVDALLLDLATTRIDDLVSLLVRAHVAGGRALVQRMMGALAAMSADVLLHLFVGLLNVDRRDHLASSCREIFAVLCGTHRAKARETLRAVLLTNPVFAPPLMNVYAFGDLPGLVEMLLESDLASATWVVAKAASDDHLVSSARAVFGRIRLACRTSRRARVFVESFNGEYPELAARLTA